MEKYLIIIGILVILFYLMQENNKEDFSNSLGGGADDTAAVQTLAKLASQLMAGGATVPGDLNVSGKINGTGDVTFNGNLAIKNGLNVTNALTAKSLNVSSAVQIGPAGTTAFISAPANNKLMVTKEDGKTSGDLQVNNLTLDGNLILSKYQRKYRPGAFFSIRGNAAHTALYNGWNFLWIDHTWTEHFRNKIKWNGSSAQNYFNYTMGTDMRLSSDGDQNWTPRFLAVMPGYKAKLYYWITGWTMGNSKEYPVGEYDWSNGSPSNQRCHVIALALDDENLPPDSV